MNKYITKSGQNLYDVALTIYGSVEGIFDLLLSNREISLETVLAKGTELSYHDDFILNRDIANWFIDNEVTVKNGNTQIRQFNVLEEIKDWHEKTNSQNFDAITSKFVISVSGVINKPNISIGGQTNRPGTSIGGTTQRPNTFYSNWGTSNSFNQTALKNSLYAAGMIELPSDPDELEEYYELAALPKFKIVQLGKESAITMEIPQNHFVAIDWGDGEEMSFYHYKGSPIIARHSYEGVGEHCIILYGTNSFKSLDFTKTNGIYYALTDIKAKKFITPFPNAEELNKLIIT